MLPCMFCKRRDTKCIRYNIYECLQDNLYPYIDIIELLGDVKKYLHEERFICHECLFIIRTIIVFRDVLMENVQKKDNELGLVSVIPAFQVFKNQIFSDSIYGDFQDISEDENEEPVAVNNDSDTDSLTGTLYSVDYATDSSSRRTMTPNSQEIEKAFKRRRRRRRATHFTHRKGEQKSRSQSRLYSRTDSTSNYPRSRAGSRSSRASSTVSVMSCRSGPVYDEHDNLITMSTRYISQLDAERRNKKTNSNVFECHMDACLRRYEAFDELVEHTKNVHCLSDVLLREDYVKLLDEKNERSKSRLRPETPNPHKERYKYPCLVRKCLKQCETFDDLADHKLKGHNAIAKYWCTECDEARFTTQADLTFHTLVRHNVKTNCLLCSESLNSTIELQQHLHDHTHFSFPCKYCDRSFLDYESLKGHQKVHVGDRKKKRRKRSNPHTIISRADIIAPNVERPKEVEADPGFTRIREQSGEVEKDLDYAFLFSGKDFVEYIDEIQRVEESEDEVMNEDEVLDDSDGMVLEMNEESLIKVIEEDGGNLLLDLHEKSSDTENNLVIVEDGNFIEEEEEEDNAATIEQGNTTIEEGSATIEERNVTIKGDNAIVEKDNVKKTVKKGNAVIEEGNATIQERNATIEEENSTVGKSIVTVKEGNATIQEDRGDNTTVQKDNVIIKEDNETVEEGSVTIEENDWTIEEGSATIREDNETIEEENVPVEEDYATVEENNLVTFDESSFVSFEENIKVEEASMIITETVIERLASMEENENIQTTEENFLVEENPLSTVEEIVPMIETAEENVDAAEASHVTVEENICETIETVPKVAENSIVNKLKGSVESSLIDSEDSNNFVLSETENDREPNKKKLLKAHKPKRGRPRRKKIAETIGKPMKMISFVDEIEEEKSEPDYEKLRKKPVVVLNDIMPMYVALNEKKQSEEQRVQIQCVPCAVQLDDDALMESLDNLKRENLKNITEMKVSVRLSPISNSNDINCSPKKKSFCDGLTITPVDSTKLLVAVKKRKAVNDLTITPIKTKSKKKKPIPADLNAMPLNEAPKMTFDSWLPPEYGYKKKRPPPPIVSKKSKIDPKVVSRHLDEAIARVVAFSENSVLNKRLGMTQNVKKVKQKKARPSVSEEESSSVSTISQSALFTKSAMERLNRKKDVTTAGSSKWT